MKFKIVLILFLATNLLAQVDPQTPRGQTYTKDQIGSANPNEAMQSPWDEDSPCGSKDSAVTLEVTPNTDRYFSSDYRGTEPATREVRFVGRRNMERRHGGVIYLITTRGRWRIPEVPIRDLGGQILTEDTIWRLVSDLGQEIRDRDFHRYVGLTTQGVFQRAQQHRLATRTNPRRRLPRELLQTGDGAMHALLTGVHDTQLRWIEALLISELEATGPRGLNGNAGHQEEPERGILGQVVVTPGTATPGQIDNRDLMTLVGQELMSVAQGDAPAFLQNVLYLMTPAMRVEMPIIDLHNQLINQEQLGLLASEIQESFQGFQFEHYIGQVTAGELRNRRPQTRAREHARAGIESPFRRLPFAIRRTNEQTGAPVQMHALFYNVNPDQINALERWLIEVFGGLNQFCWNSTPGSSKANSVTGSSEPRKRGRDGDSDSDSGSAVASMQSGSFAGSP